MKCITSVMYNWYEVYYNYKNAVVDILTGMNCITSVTHNWYEVYYNYKNELQLYRLSTVVSNPPWKLSPEIYN